MQTNKSSHHFTGDIQRRMTLLNHIDDIRNRLKESAYKDEAAVSNHIVNRLLQALNWPMYNPQVIIPEYSVEGRRVDFALCHPHEKPLIFIEVKQVGNIQGAEKQLFEYAFHTGVPIALLTDGREWHFFSPSGQGNYRERRVCKLDLIEDDSEKIAKRLKKYLNYESVQSDEAVKAIAADYQYVVDERHIQKGLPKAWNLLIREPDEFLLEIIVEKTMEICGKRPTPEHVITFLQNLSQLPIEQKPTTNVDVVLDKQPSHTYEYAGEHLTGKLARPLIIELFGDKGETKKQDIITAVTQIHRERGGVDAKAAINQLFNSALQALEKQRYSRNIEKGSGRWEVYKDPKKTG